MAILKGILKDSWAHYKNLEMKIRKRLKELPAGSIFKRKIGAQTYYYLNIRKGTKVVSHYLGKEKPSKIEEGVRQRRLLIKQQKEVDRSLKLLAKTRPRIRRD